MELITGIGKFIVEVLHYTAWPAALLWIIYMFRKPITRLIDRIKRFKHGDTEIDFSNAAKILRTTAIEDRSAAIHVKKLTKGDLDWPSVVKLTAKYTATLIFSLNIIPIKDARERPDVVRDIGGRIKEMMDSFENEWTREDSKMIAVHFGHARDRISKILDEPF